MKILKCSDPTCNTHHALGDKVVTFSQGKLAPTPSGWTCDWHADPGGALSDHVRAVEWSRAVGASVDRSGPAGTPGVPG